MMRCVVFFCFHAYTLLLFLEVGQGASTTDVCASGPCQNEGTCVAVGTDQWKCECQNGFGGTDCSHMDICASEPCINGGNCTHPNGVWEEFKCLCLAEYEGLYCQTFRGACASNPCMNGATCVYYETTEPTLASFSSFSASSSITVAAAASDAADAERTTTTTTTTTNTNDHLISILSRMLSRPSPLSASSAAVIFSSSVSPLTLSSFSPFLKCMFPFSSSADAAATTSSSSSLQCSWPPSNLFELFNVHHPSFARFYPVLSMWRHDQLQRHHHDQSHNDQALFMQRIQQRTRLHAFEIQQQQRTAQMQAQIRRLQTDNMAAVGKKISGIDFMDEPQPQQQQRQQEDANLFCQQHASSSSSSSSSSDDPCILPFPAQDFLPVPLPLPSLSSSSSAHSTAKRPDSAAHQRAPSLSLSLSESATSSYYVCKCASGWRGALCSEKYDECQALGQNVVCQHGGACQNTGNGGSHICNCTSEVWTGVNCDVAVCNWRNLIQMTHDLGAICQCHINDTLPRCLDTICTRALKNYTCWMHLREIFRCVNAITDYNGPGKIWAHRYQECSAAWNEPTFNFKAALAHEPATYRSSATSILSSRCLILCVLLELVLLLLNTVL